MKNVCKHYPDGGGVYSAARLQSRFLAVVGALLLVANFTVTCATSNTAQGYTATATGSGSMAGYTYTINHQGTRSTTAHPKGALAGCWSMKGTVCDT